MGISRAGLGLDHRDDRTDLVDREVFFGRQGRVPQGVKVRQRPDAFLDLERFAGCTYELYHFPDLGNLYAFTMLHQKGIEVDLSNIPAHDCLIRAYQIDWESIFANLITNAMWAITKHHGARKIRFSIVEDATHFTLSFDDSAFGLEAGTEEQVFDAGFSTKRNNKGEKDGTGMGLYIVKSFVEENTGGTVRAIAKGELGGACFIIKVPKSTKET